MEPLPHRHQHSSSQPMLGRDGRVLEPTAGKWCRPTTTSRSGRSPITVAAAAAAAAAAASTIWHIRCCWRWGWQACENIACVAVLPRGSCRNRRWKKREVHSVADNSCLGKKKNAPGKKTTAPSRLGKKQQPPRPASKKKRGLRQKGVYLPIFAPKRGTPRKHMGNLQ